MGTVRWGVLSTADIGMSKVTPAIQAATNAEVVAIASRDAARGEAAAGQLGIPRSYGTYEALLAADDIDAVYIPLPNDQHAEWTIKAAESGKHVLCEKPLAMSAAQAQEVTKACADAGVRLQEAFMYRHHPTWVEVVRLVRSGSIGELQGVQTWFSYHNDDPQNIRNQLEHGGGAVMDIGCYPINLSRMLFSAEPATVTAQVRRDPEMGVDTLASAVLEFPGGGQSAFTVCIRCEDFQRVHIVGTSGRIEVEIPFNIPSDRPTRILRTSGGEPPVAPATETLTFPPADQYTIQAELFGRSVLSGTEVPVPASDAVANMTVVDAILGG
ncbi:MAG: Gfo/Idh/MocA family oxidoreductase [Actinomycetota bacterium]|nr:Gfo/Idh/MocA family oxidoreductase [Actinomycetota bacterium]MDH5279262.1 Gfo/Idh/MocA family oxidoreductase [Actinomycetota bacterium]